ncbi:phenylalanine--tRNA ligase alpha subunit [Anaerotruncus sp. CAG:390]|nr:phenylalanine--tRNA ligase alpha subunit [Anaerotruncus sp. CAG:390]
MKEILQKIRSEALERINSADADLEALRVRYLGKKGELTAVLRGMAGLSPDERPVVGQLANKVRAEIENAIAERTAVQKQKALEAQLLAERVDDCVPSVGTLQPPARRPR